MVCVGVVGVVVGVTCGIFLDFKIALLDWREVLNACFYPFKEDLFSTAQQKKLES